MLSYYNPHLKSYVYVGVVDDLDETHEASDDQNQAVD